MNTFNYGSPKKFIIKKKFKSISLNKSVEKFWKIRNIYVAEFQNNPPQKKHTKKNKKTERVNRIFEETKNIKNI